jgi:hypothetical protein
MDSSSQQSPIKRKAFSDLTLNRARLGSGRRSAAPAVSPDRSQYLPSSSGVAKMVIMSRSTQQLEARLARVEREVAELKAALGVKRSEPWYRQIVGDFAGDKAYAEIIRLGRLIRRGKLKG